MVLPEGFLPESEWKAILRPMPIPCVDVIVEKDAKKKRFHDIALTSSA